MLNCLPTLSSSFAQAFHLKVSSLNKIKLCGKRQIVKTVFGSKIDLLKRKVIAVDSLVKRMQADEWIKSKSVIK